MRILIDGTSLLMPSAGVKNYVYYWAEALQKAASDRVGIFPFLTRLPPLDHQSSVLGPRSTLARLALVGFLNRRGNPAINALRFGCDVFHISQHLVNLPARTRVTATIYDMSCWRVPDSHTPANVAATKAYSDRILRRADATIAISEHTRSDAIEILGLDPDRVQVIYPGVAEEFFRPCPESTRRVRRQYSLDKPYILNIGTIEPRKNVRRLINAYAALPERFRREVDLVFAGFLGWKSEKEAALLVQTAGVKYLGYVPESDITGLTAGALMLAYPSLYEGFGFPVAQAMAAGVPVVTSRNSSLAEICGDAASLVDCYDEEDISAAIARLLDTPSEAQTLIERGKNRAAAYTWERSARASLEFFQRVAQ
jgi:glycosyltransferase involved in cell wall biosynthesis